jgi:hypothetical protein
MGNAEVAKPPMLLTVGEWHDSHAVLPTGTWIAADSTTTPT